MIKYNKLKAFTLAEIMILLLTLSILLAAFAPVFTRRYVNAGSDDVWSYVVADDNFDAYYHVLSDNYTAQAFIGLTPTDKFKVQQYSSDGDNNILYSKLVIAASKALSGGRGLQRQMQFRYGKNAGQSVGYLFAGHQNILVGGDYSKIQSGTKNNTSFGHKSLSNVMGSFNTAVGSGALLGLKAASLNTAIGSNTARLGTIIGAGNTLVGYNAALNANSTDFAYNTAVGSNSMVAASSYSRHNTAFGNYTHGGSGSGSYNVSVGYSALGNFGSGDGNTAIGAYAMNNLTRGSYNTAIGYNACLQNRNGSYITCIGANSGSLTPESGSSSIYSGSSKNDEVVLIGSKPIESDSSFLKDAAAVLEVHNKTDKNSISAPMTNIGNETVVVNGNLVVRGQSYFEVPIIRQFNTDSGVDGIPKGLVAFKLNQNVNNGNKNLFAYSGYDGAQRNGATQSFCDRTCKWHQFNVIRTNAICTIVTGGTSGGSCSPYSTNMAKSWNGPSKSYDWFTTTDKANILDSDCNSESQKPAAASSYIDQSFNCKILLERYQNAASGSVDNSKGPGVDKSLAHNKEGGVGNSPCPNLSSDKRLKNIGNKFTAGLDEIRKLNIYNYTFKNDKNKLPHVGVIAQDLRLVFPNAVSKGDDGYYRIRWDEMFYAAINSIKTLNDKLEKLVAKISTDRNRIAVLKKDNADLNSKLDKLADELTQLETKKRK